jgi:hypothetical protein
MYDEHDEEKDMYNVSDYTDLELLNILDLNANPTDRELEAKILFLIHKYENMQNTSGDQLAKFFHDIHHHFFDLSDGEDEEEEPDSIKEGFTDLKSQVAAVNKQYKTSKPKTTMIPVSGVVDENTLTKNDKTSTLDSDIQELNKDIKQLGVQIGNAKDMDKTKSGETSFVTNLSYAKDSMNPLLTQTIKRIVSIDSQYRENKQQISTDYTFNLSENLKDVVSLKLYSIQVPFTWYTISENFGCNFFYLKGNSAGINTGDFDYKIEIPSGNYVSAEKLIAAIKDSITTLETDNPDVSFGTTGLSYNTNTMKANMTIDINQIYRETSYYLYFPYWTNPNDSTGGIHGTRYQSIPGFFGMNYTNYKFADINSQRTLSLTTNIITNEQDILNRQYYIDETNNFFTIISYYGPNEYSTDSIIDKTYKVTLNLSGLVTRNQLVTEVSTQLTNASFLQESQLQRIDITDSNIINNGNSYYKLQLKLNRKTTSNAPNLKTVVQFPTENITGGYNKIWTGTSSCFRFEYTSYELSNIISESKPVEQQLETYQVGALQIYLKCVKPNFNIATNDYQINLRSNLTSGYTLLEFLNETNYAVGVANTQTITSRNTIGDFDVMDTRAYIDNNNKFNFSVDITKRFKQDMYQLDLSNSYLTNILKLQPYYTDLSGTNVFHSSFDVNSRYIFDSSFIFIVKPANAENNYGNKNEVAYVIPAPQNKTFFTYTDLQNAINESFSNAVDPDGQNTLTGTNIQFQNNLLTRKIDCTFTIVIQKIITQTDYSIQFNDPLSTPNDLTTNKWYTKFYINQNQILYAYDLVNVVVPGTPYSRVIATSPIEVPQITLIEDVNNFFYLKPYSPGVTDSHGYNDIKITIPPNIPYSRDALVAAINTALSANTILSGSSLTILTINNIEYAKFRINLNKIYTAKDYRVVFYDPFSFSSCSPVSRSIRNTTWDTTLGWLLGMRLSTIYYLSQYATTTSNKITISSDTTISLNLYNYFLLCLDDFTQSHLNDGLITLTGADQDIAMPTYVNKANYECDPVTGKYTYNTSTITDGNSLTQKQIYSLNAIANTKRASIVLPGETSNAKSLGPGPYVTDVFGFIPMKTTGLATGAVYVDYGGSLQNQERVFFGPVNIQRMGVRLLSDRGEPVNLNGSNWSFSLIVEQLYQQKPTVDKDKKK